MSYFNFTKVNALDFYHDIEIATNEPKIKGFFISFLVKPDLNIPDMSIFKTDVGHNIPLGNSYRSYNFEDQIRKLFRGSLNAEVRNNLTHDRNGLNYFSNIFTNLVESITYPDIGSNSEDTLVTQDKSIFKLPVTESGVSGLTFNVKMRENEGHDALRFVSVWHKYIQAVVKGNLYPKLEYLQKNIIDYKASLYTLHLKPDFKTVTMFSKYTGVYPSNIPLSSMSESIEDVTDVTLDIEFTYDKFEFLNEDILRELNLLTAKTPITNTELSVNSSYTLSKKSIPFIYKLNGTPFYEIDLNGLRAKFNEKGCQFSQTPASLFGASFSGVNFGYFPAPTNQSMVNISTGNSMFSNINPGDHRIIEDKST